MWSCFRHFLCHLGAENECSDVADATGNSASDNYCWHQKVGAAPPQIFVWEGYTSNPATPMPPTLTPTFRHKMVILRFLTKAGQVITVIVIMCVKEEKKLEKTVIMPCFSIQRCSFREWRHHSLQIKTFPSFKNVHQQYSQSHLQPPN